MSKILSKTVAKLPAAAVALSLGLALSGCAAGVATNRSVDSVHQPVVERSNYTLDVNTSPGGIAFDERQRLDDWFQAMNLRYGDRIAVDDPQGNPATYAAIQEVASRHGVLLSREAPVTPGYVAPGAARVIVSRSTAHVPGCPNWSAKSDTNIGSATSPNFGCSINSNLASMVADPEHLVRGATTRGETTVMSSDKAINAYREAKPTGGGELKASSTGGK